MTKSKSTATQSPPRLSAQDPRFATVLVGPDKKRFVVHQDLLTYHSDFFKAALMGKFKEADEKAITLHEDRPLIFEFLVHWMYHKELPTDKNASSELLGQWTQDDDSGRTKTGNLLYLHVLSDKYDVAKLRTDTLNELFLHMESKHSDLPSSSHISYAFNNLPVRSALLDYLVDLYRHYAGSIVRTSTAARNYPPVFPSRVLRSHAQEVEFSPAAMRLCDYHKHDAENKRSACAWKDRITK